MDRPVQLPPSAGTPPEQPASRRGSRGRAHATWQEGGTRQVNGGIRRRLPQESARILPAPGCDDKGQRLSSWPCRGPAMRQRGRSARSRSRQNPRVLASIPSIPFAESSHYVPTSEDVFPARRHTLGCRGSLGLALCISGGRPASRPDRESRQSRCDEWCPGRRDAVSFAPGDAGALRAVAGRQGPG